MIQRADSLRWYEGPIYRYKHRNATLSVNVAHSSWPIRGLAITKAVVKALKEFKKTAPGGPHVLDFGAGSWLRYLAPLRRELPAPNLYAVEFEEAFRDAAKETREAHAPNVTIWTPSRFRKEERKYDLIVAINVLNTMPEQDHQRDAFAALATRLNPMGKLFVYQRIWAKGESEDAGGIPYGEGWLVPQSNHPHHTYRGRVGATWFKAQAERHKLRVISLETTITSSNTFMRAWEKPFD